MLKRVLISIILIMITGISLISIVAQDLPIPLPSVPIEVELQPTADPEHPNRNMVLYQYRIAYIIGENALMPDHVVAPSRLNEDIGASIFTTWDTFLQANTDMPFEAVILHKSALSFLDQEWISTAYRSGVVISLIDIYYPEISELLNFHCGVDKPEEWYEKDYHITFYFNVYTVASQDRQKVIEALDDCRDIHSTELISRIQVTRGRSQESLEGSYGYSIFNGNLQSALESVTSVYEDARMNETSSTGENE
jgi:hypothetical protein